MHIILIHNPNAGDGKINKRTLVSALKGEGHEVAYDDNYRSRLRRKLRNKTDIVIAAGGDGTLVAVARGLAGTETPMLGVPLGTANNVARGLGWSANIEEVLATLRSPRQEKMDIGLATGSWGERYFVESAGVGLFGHALDEHFDQGDKAPPRAAGVLCGLLEKYRGRKWDLVLDGQEICDRFVLVDMMNVPMMGPNLCLSPSANPFDGLLDVVMVHDDDRAELSAYLSALSKGQTPKPPKLQIRQAKHVEIKLEDHGLRIDDRMRPRVGAKASHYADLRVLPGALRVWLPEVKK